MISFISIDLLVPLGALLAVVLVGWKRFSSKQKHCLALLTQVPFPKVFLFLWKWICPVLIALILLANF